jgi:hypothetical protein
MTLQYLGFDHNGRDAELFAGEEFETHLPSQNQMVIRSAAGEVVVNVGDCLSRDADGQLLVGA